MLVCLHCQSENPDVHKFCQNCGRSLTEKECPRCGTLVSLDIEHCPHCGTTTGTIWRVILSSPLWNRQLCREPELSLVGDTIAQNELECNPELERVMPSAPVFMPVDGYLDIQQRYQLLEPLPERSEKATKIETRVLDCQPLQPSLLDPLYYQKPLSFSVLQKETIAQTLKIPAIARSYLILQELYPSLPLPILHDAWEHSGIDVILLEDRTDLLQLVDFWRKKPVSLLQILHWLREVVDYWAVLQPHRCCRSLLELDNLRIDAEDYALCLQRLYTDDPNQPPCLQDLGYLWQTLFEQSRRTQNGDLFLLCRDLQTGDIVSVDVLRSRIEAIAAPLQSDQTKLMTFPESADPTPTNLPLDEAQPANPDPDLPIWTPGAFTEPSTADLTPTEEAIEEALELDDADEDLASDGDDPTVVLPMRLISIEDVGQTDIGRQRDHNEDCFYIETAVRKLEGMQGRVVGAKGLYILCDGMGGHAGGEVASALAVDTLRKYFEVNWQDKLPNEQNIREAIYLANQAIYDRNQQNARSGSGRMGTTLVLVLVQDTEAVIAHVGDSRLYRFSRRQGLEQVTVDHEVGQREIQRGVEPDIAYNRPDAYQLTQALGPRDENFISPDVKVMELNEDMIFLLCSDGLSDNDLLELHWQSYLEPMLSIQSSLEQGVSQLIELANQFNGHDNITAIAIRVRVRPSITQLQK
ncbi:MAG: serine/threonine phosphatase [Cyanobacteria bacterium CRU_2_1]|nr:serine/threonine phosphatase [Cyanobacteria bacterium RU_5_0]NJR60823.1 serine/threonine phosphatase [Cyanobacteria bacterium CRU_2_1]